MLETPKLILRQWKETDLKTFAASNQDSVVCEFFPSLLTEEESREQALIYQKEIATEVFSFFASQRNRQLHHESKCKVHTCYGKDRHELCLRLPPPKAC